MSEHTYDLNDGWCHAHRAYCTMTEPDPDDVEARYWSARRDR